MIEENETFLCYFQISVSLILSNFFHFSLWLQKFFFSSFIFNYTKNKCVSFEQSLYLQGKYAFRLNVDIICISDDGNLTDAIILAMVRLTCQISLRKKFIETSCIYILIPIFPGNSTFRCTVASCIIFGWCCMCNRRWMIYLSRHVFMLCVLQISLVSE